MKFQLTKQFVLSALTLLSSLPASAAPVAPDAGQTIRELQKQPDSNTPKAIVPLHLEGDTARKDTVNDDARIEVKAIHVSGSSAFAAAELEALVADLVGSERTLAELDKAAGRITAWYRERGYVVARAYLPVQEIKDGVVVISVLEGRLDKQRVSNQSRLSDERANDYLSGIKSGDTLQAQPVDRMLLLLTDTPGVGGARATLQPGASVGTSDLLIELDPSAPYFANVELDNYGNRYTGEYRLDGALALSSPLKMGDQLTLRALTSDKNLTYARIAYQIPVGGSGLRVGAAYSDIRYRLGKEFTALQAHGTATSGSLFAVYPFIRSQASNLSATLTWEDKKLGDRTDAPITTSDKYVQLANLGLAGNHQDALGGAGLTSFDLSLAAGRLSMDTVSRAADATSAQSNGAFTRLAYNLNRLQRLTDRNTLSVALAGQQAGKNLNSSEKFFLGGAYGVRAYPQGEGSGDEGWLANLELRHSFNDTLQGMLFYDAGSVTFNRNQFAAAANTRYISGAGVGANANLAGVQIKTYLAWRTGGGRPTSEPVTLNRNPRLWLQASKQF
ncbi:MAG TPA: ShlB/FhaC/HecB family hemolysin secretion/activation protein [Gallionella sp.]|nr:ShlB/FhaC/HecB family hemolysin secretion/activation protein [Gallionella sp.]